ncbi:aKG-HExxH-type peptide beta-hydroxylase [Mucilaginibacter gotjawali]|uniref:Uncharacterized protein n=2 Tax=Mucilaginibacter gotjawali TaxID=1550579 RepID=A0A839SME3_9SPHI|nr:HEXXH motif-containing putative peptide modification protein [Mucilaginibacter gotjawali]MBB3058742.1 hypothetical protein [Mucilaginibacter gotjawali]BAU55653.1 hypothetical protein MgSA37_03844 [Mucilaginibacter gotjawali]
MFNQIENIGQKWVNEQLSLLNDTQLLLQDIDMNLGKHLQNFIDCLSSLNKNDRDSFCKDHVFHNWLNKIKTEILGAYEIPDFQINSELLSDILSLLHFALAVLTESELTFSVNRSVTTRFLLPVSGLFFDFNSISITQEKLFCLYFPKSKSILINNKEHKLSNYQSFESIKIADSNFAFFADPTEDEYTIEFDNEIDLPKWISTLNKAMDILKTDYSSYQLVTNFTSYLVPLKQMEIVKNLSFSVRNLPNVIFKNNELTPYLIAETLVHESDHQLFYSIEKFESFWLSDVKLQKPIFFSPWRDDPRPLDGILRGLSSFARVSKYYSTVLKTFDFMQEEIELVGAMLLTRLRQSETALNTIFQSCELSSFGKQYLYEIKETLDNVNAVTKNFHQYNRWNGIAVNSMEIHRRNWELINTQK